MKEATGEGSMTIITIVIIVALGVAAAVIVGMFLNQSTTEANKVTSSGIKTNMTNGGNCTKGVNPDGSCVQ